MLNSLMTVVNYYNLTTAIHGRDSMLTRIVCQAILYSFTEI